MAPYDSESGTRPPSNRPQPSGRRKVTRYAVPAGVAAVAAATIGLVPALANTGDPSLPKISAQQLIEKIAASDAQQVSGTVKISTDFGLPSLAGASLAPGMGGDKSGSSADPQAKLTELASGTHTLRVAADGPEKQKVSILENAAEYSLVHNGDDVWAYDSKSNEVMHSKAPQENGKKDSGSRAGKLPKNMPTTPKEMADEALKAAGDTTSVKVEGTRQVAGRDAYQLVIRPKQAGSTVDSIRVAVDADNGVPLKFSLLSTGGGKAVVDAGFTKVDFGKPSASTFDFQPPKGAKVTQEDGAKARKDAGKSLRKGSEGADSTKDIKVTGKGWASIAQLKTPGGKGLPTAGSKDVPAEAQQLIDGLGDKVKGQFGSGTVFSTRLVNALITDDGTVYAGAVTKDALVKAANAAH